MLERMRQLDVLINLSTEHGAYSRKQLPWVEWFPDIIVGTDLQSNDAVDIFLERRKKYYWYARSLPSQIAANIQARSVRQHDVEDNQVDFVKAERIVHRPSVRRQGHLEILFG
jgi:hypothetical protein